MYVIHSLPHYVGCWVLSGDDAASRRAVLPYLSLLICTGGKATKFYSASSKYTKVFSQLIVKDLVNTAFSIQILRPI